MFQNSMSRWSSNSPEKRTFTALFIQIVKRQLRFSKLSLEVKNHCIYVILLLTRLSYFKTILGKMHGSNCVRHLGCGFSEILQENSLNAIRVWPSCYEKICYNWDSSYPKILKKFFVLTLKEDWKDISTWNKLVLGLANPFHFLSRQGLYILWKAARNHKQDANGVYAE